MIKLSPAAYANLPVNPQFITEADQGFQAFDPAYPKLRRHAKYPGVCFRFCSSLHELLGTCDGMLFFTTHNTYPTFGVMAVGDAVDDLFTHAYSGGHFYGHLSERGNVALKATSDEFLPGMIWNDSSAGYAPTATQEQVAAIETMSFPDRVPLGKPTFSANWFIGIISDADWGYGTFDVSVLGHIGNGHWPGFTLVKRLPLTTVDRLMKDFVLSELRESVPADAREFVSDAIAEYSARPPDMTEVTLPFIYTAYEDYPFVAGINGHSHGVRELIGLPRIQPVPVWGALNEAVSSVCYFVCPREDGTLMPVIMPTVRPGDPPGKRALGDVLAGLLPLRNWEEGDLGPKNDQPLIGATLADAITTVLGGIIALDSERMTPGLAAAAPTFDQNGVALTTGGLENVKSMPPILRAILDGPCGYHGLTNVLDAIREIMQRASALAKAKY